MWSKDWPDYFGSLASTVCAVHCAICGFLPALFGILGLGFLLSARVEWMLVIVAIVFALTALVLGWRQHKSTRVAAFLLLGIGGLLLARGLEAGSDHHHHEGEAHSEAGEHHAGHSDEGDHHEDSGHLVGALVGSFAGLLLLVGHILNVRETRRCRVDCCDPSSAA